MNLERGIYLRRAAMEVVKHGLSSCQGLPRSAYKNHRSIGRFEHLASDTTVNPSTDPGPPMCAQDDPVHFAVSGKIENDMSGVTHLHSNLCLHLAPFRAFQDASEVVEGARALDLPLLINGDDFTAEDHV